MTVLRRFECEVGMSLAAITYATERWASIAAFTAHCQSVVCGYDCGPYATRHYERTPPLRVRDPIDDSSRGITDKWSRKGATFAN